MAMLPMDYFEKLPIKVLTYTYGNVSVTSTHQYQLSGDVRISNYTAIGTYVSNFSGQPLPFVPVLLNAQQLWLLSESQTISQLKINVIYVPNDKVDVQTS